MKPRVKSEINDIINELGAINRELEDISEGMVNEFKGIASTLCARSIKALSNRYTYAKKELSKIRYKI